MEGHEDKVAITDTLKKLNKIKMHTEELYITAITAGGKQSIPFFIRVLNAFKINYSVFQDLDILSEMSEDDKKAKEKEKKLFLI